MSIIRNYACMPRVEHRKVALPTGELVVTAQTGQYPLDELIGFAARANAKRGFLFVSKVLGKHWPVKPRVMRDIHEALAQQIPTDLPGPILFIALAETAIGLGQGVFEAFLDIAPGHHGLFLHTTRYRVGDAPLIEFEEAHSHAPRQFLHMPDQEDAQGLLMRAKSIVLIDDEASTGNTFVNLAAACRTLNPGIERVHLVTITNFMGDEANDKLSERFGLPVTHGSALNGEYAFLAGRMRPADSPAQRFDSSADRGASPLFGRMGLLRGLHLPVDLIDRLAQEIPQSHKVLVLGTGEFMHPAFLLGRALEDRGLDVVVQSTTRSPVLEWGAIASAMTFPDNYGEGIANFIYNVQPGQYDQVIVCHETPPNDALLKFAARINARMLHFKSENHIEEVPVR